MNDYIRKAVELADFPEKLWNNHSVDPQTGCWWWMGYRNPKGYGRLSVGGRQVMAHRYSWESVYGPIPDGKMICHHCDNPACINPDHLFLSDAAGNAADRDKKGRFKPHSRERYQAMQLKCAKKKRKLTPSDIRYIRSCDHDGVSLGRMFDVHKSMICLIRKGKSYADVR